MTEMELILVLLVAVAGLASLAGRLGIPYPILLVVGGAALGFVPGLPPIQVDPTLVFLLFVPPLVFVAAFFTSWRDVTANVRSILSLAVGLVLASTFVVGTVAHVVIGMPWAPALVFGALVSNTDTTAIVAIAQQTNLPNRIVTILESESLFNDAVSLTAFRLAIVATITGAFSLEEGGIELAIAVVGAVAIGLAVGWLTAAARVRSGDPRIVIIVSVITPYAAYIAADQVDASGILAVVVAGLYLGRREWRVEDAETRLQAHAVWDVFVFVLNGLLFILVGVQLRPIWAALAIYETHQVIGATIAVNLAVMLTRIVWVAATTVVPLRGGRALVGGSLGGWRDSMILSWSGLRGGDTLAAALSVPLLTSSGVQFPYRAEIIFLTFTVIVVSLVGQGLTLPPLIRRLGLPGDDTEAHEEALARRAAAEAVLVRLNALAREERVPSYMVTARRRRLEHEASLLEAQNAERDPVADHAAGEQRLQREVLQTEREAVVRLRDQGEISDQVLRRVQRDLDLEESRSGH